MRKEREEEGLKDVSDPWKFVLAEGRRWYGLVQEGLRKTTRVESAAGSEREGLECLEHK